MSHLAGISLENFRVFKERTDFEFAPITVLTGTNGSGKSSLIKALKLVEGNFRHLGGEWDFWEELDFRMGEHDLGNFANAVNRSRPDDPICIALPFSLTGVRDPLKANFTFVRNQDDRLQNGQLIRYEITREPGGEMVMLIERRAGTWELSLSLDFKYLRSELDTWASEIQKIKEIEARLREKDPEGKKEESDFRLEGKAMRQYLAYKIKGEIERHHPLSQAEWKRLITPREEEYNKSTFYRRYLPSELSAKLPSDSVMWIKEWLWRIDKFDNSDSFYFVYPEWTQDHWRYDHLIREHHIPFFGGLMASLAMPKDKIGDADKLITHLPDEPLLNYYFLLEPEVYADWPIREKIEQFLADTFPGQSLDEIRQHQFAKELDMLNEATLVKGEQEKNYSLRQWIAKCFADIEYVQNGYILQTFPQYSAFLYRLESRQSLAYPYSKEDDLFDLFNDESDSQYNSSNDKGADIPVSEVDKSSTQEVDDTSPLPKVPGWLSDNERGFLGSSVYKNWHLHMNALFNQLAHFDNLPNIRSIPRRIYDTSDQQLPLQRMINELNKVPMAKLEEMNTSLAPWIKAFGLGDGFGWDIIAEGTALRLYLVKGGEKSQLIDEGYGYSQLLPILLQVGVIIATGKEPASGLDANASFYVPSILIIEEPETNLHPKLQSLLADFFVDVAKQLRVQFILETHSEYLIRKLQYLTAKGEITPEDTAIYYFYPPDEVPVGRKQVERLRIEEDGGLDKEFGPGFFDEAVNWKIELMKLKKNRQN